MLAGETRIGRKRAVAVGPVTGGTDTGGDGLGLGRVASERQAVWPRRAGSGGGGARRAVARGASSSLLYAGRFARPRHQRARYPRDAAQNKARILAYLPGQRHCSRANTSCTRGVAMFQVRSSCSSVGDLHQLPPDRGREVAVAGRSNAGKSSAINALCGRRKLAFVSRTPGRTQLINFFQLGDGAYLVDLPGYGYAKVPAACRRAGSIAEPTCKPRALRGLILVMDARHPLTPLDRQMLDWFAPTRPVHILLTKADKLSRQAAQRSSRATAVLAVATRAAACNCSPARR